MYTLSIFSSFLVTIIMLSMGFFLFVKNWKSQINIYSALTAFFASGIILGMFLIYAFPEQLDLLLINRISQASTIFVFASLLVVITVYFNENQKKLPFYKVIIIFIPAIILSYFTLFTELQLKKVYFTDDKLTREYGFVYYIYILLATLYSASALITAVLKYRQLTNIYFKRQVRFITSIGIFAVMMSSVSAIFLPAIFNYTKLYVIGASVPFLVLILSIFYSIIYLELMDITTAIHKTAIYFLISALIFLPIYLIILIYLNTSWIYNNVPLYVVGCFFSVVFIFYSISVQPIIDKIFKRKLNEFGKILDNFNKDLYNSKNFTDIITRTVDILFDTLYLKSITYFSFSKDDNCLKKFYYKGINLEIDSFDLDSPIARWLSKNHEILSSDKTYIENKSFNIVLEELNIIFKTTKVKLIMPQYHDNKLTGFYCLGEKLTLISYKPDEILKLKIFNSEINIHVSRVLSYEDWSRDQYLSGIIDLASDIKANAIPEKIPKISEVDFGVFCIPKHRQGSDYFDIIRPNNRGISVIATEMEGLGINNALYSVILKSIITSSISEAHSTFSIMQKMNNAVYYYDNKSKSIMAYYFYYDFISMKLIYSNAGYTPLEIYRVERNDFESLTTDGIQLGYDLSTSYGMGRTNLLIGDIGILYNRNLIKSKNRTGEEFGLNRLHSLIKENRRNHSKEIIKIVKDSFENFLGLTPPLGDISLIIFKIK